MIRLFLFLGFLSAFITPSLASNNSGAVVYLCIDINQAKYRGETFNAVPFSVRGMNDNGGWVSINIPDDAAFGVPFCGSLGYVEEDASAPVATWDVLVTLGMSELVAAIETGWHNNNSAKITDNPQTNAFWCASDSDPSCLTKQSSQIQWSKDTQGPIYLFVDLDDD